MTKSGSRIKSKKLSQNISTFKMKGRNTLSKHGKYENIINAYAFCTIGKEAEQQ